MARILSDLGHTVLIADGGTELSNVAAAQASGWQALRFETAAQCETALRRGGWL